MSFVGRRTSAAVEALLICVILAMVAGLIGWTAITIAAPRAVSQQQTLDGTLIVRHGDDFAHGHETGHAYVIATTLGEIELAFEGKPPDDAMAGQMIRLRGHQQGRQFLVAAGGNQSLGPSPGSRTGATGARTVAIVLLNFSNDQSEPYSPEYAAGVAFNNADSVAAYYAENSWGQLTISGDVFGWYTLPDSQTSCAFGSWASSATTAASSAGVDLAAYDHVVYAFPYVPSCAWGGMATLPGRSSWLNGPSSMSLHTMAHELGHNFGTHHASALSCAENGVRVAISATCTTNEYGDPFSVMGSARHYQHTAFSRSNFGWLESADAQTVTAKGIYAVAPIEFDDPSAAKVLRIPRAETGSYLTLEFRQPFGTSFDNFATTDPVATGVTARITGDYSGASQTQLIDATPTTATFADAPLSVGQTLLDPAYGITVTTLSVSSTAASVAIVFGSAASLTPETPAPTPAEQQPTPAPTAIPTSAPTASPSASPVATPDSEPPTAPADVMALLGKGRKVFLTWTASADNVGVADYEVFRDGVRLALTDATNLTDSVTGKSTTHLYYIVAFDAAGNASVASPVVSIGP
jgi:hypothetical protein